MRLFIADADQYLRVGLQMLLHQEQGMEVVGIAVRSERLLAQVEASQPDVLLLDWNLPGPPVTDLLASMDRLEFPLQIIILSVRPETESAALAAGADAFSSKDLPPDRLLEILRTMREIEKPGNGNQSDSE